MARFVFVYHGGSAPESEEQGKMVMAEWTAWFEKLGPAVVDGGAPLGMSRTVSARGVTDGGGSNPASGYSLVDAANIGAATELARDCPIIKAGGSVEVAEAMAM